ncbi:hypothetical protein BT93_F3150 [Corymbia citriodora subsp. variegata]|nr:hypothetical protein BT93_F3150 [Corymbia citriodora subsp. variegata]
MSFSHSNNLGLFASSVSGAVSSDFTLKLDKQSPSSHVSIALSEPSKELISSLSLFVPQSPRFPRSLSWLLNNQLPDGSWGLPDRHPLLIKEALLSTLACVIALKQWGVGERQINCGFEQHTPIGFNILLSGMIEQAGCLNLNLPLRSADSGPVSYKRNLELKRGLSEGCGIYLSYVLEGIGSLAERDMIMKHQRNNRSLFNSPATTAAALTHLQNAGCLCYLVSVLEKFGDAAATIYPLGIYARLCMTENLERLGIDRHFRKEIIDTLDDTYKCWLQDALSQFAGEDQFYNTLEGHVKYAGPVLELYWASQLIIHDDEIILDKINSWTSEFLRNGLCTGEMRDSRLESYMPIISKHFRWMMLLDFLSMQTWKGLFLNLAVIDFSNCQAIRQEEYKYLERWVKEKKSNKLKFARQKLVYCYFSAAETFLAPNYRMPAFLGPKMVLLWNVNLSADGCSEQVQIIFSAIHPTISETGDKAGTWQGRNLTACGSNCDFSLQWLEMLESMLTEVERVRTKAVPTMDEYIANASISFGLGPMIFPALHLVGPRLSEKQVESPEYPNLSRLMSTCGCLLNDIQSYKDSSLVISKRRELLKLVLQERDSIIPRACKDLFWKMSAVMHLFYMDANGFTLDEKTSALKSSP